ncbi:MAG: outer membrane beta-barrel protein [Treponemataceae bacterium]
MKKLTAITIILVLSTFTLIFGTEFSIGTVLGGFGTTSARGSGYKDFLDENGYESFVGVPYSMSFSPMADIRGQIDILKYMGIEFGVGYSQKSLGFYKDDGTDYYIYKYTFPNISIPIMIKGQIPINRNILFYAGAGVRMGFNTNLSVITYKNQKKEEPDCYSQKYNVFDLDVMIAMGTEYVFANTHYLGIRVGYDFNMVGSLRDNQQETRKIYVDNLAISLTYRYKIKDYPYNADAGFIFER